MVKPFTREKCLKTYGLVGMLYIFRDNIDAMGLQTSAETHLNILNQMSMSTHQRAPVLATHLTQ